MNIRTSIEGKRGCGWRKPGGLYMVSDGLPRHCGRLPLPLEVCPTCGSGIHKARHWTWINARELFKGAKCNAKKDFCSRCILSPDTIPERCGLLWVGEKFYSVDSFNKEAMEVGISKRIKSIPRDFKVGETVVLLAHAKAVNEESGVFTAFIPSRIEYIVKDGDSEEKLERLEKQGYSLVKVIKKGKVTVTGNNL